MKSTKSVTKTKEEPIVNLGDPDEVVAPLDDKAGADVSTDESSEEMGSEEAGMDYDEADPFGDKWEV